MSKLLLPAWPLLLTALPTAAPGWPTLVGFALLPPW